MRWAAKTDMNQGEIVHALRAVGATVQPLHTVGQGCPDLLVGFRGVNYLMEVKSHARARLTGDESAWHAAWRGQVDRVDSVDDALRLIGAI